MSPSLFYGWSLQNKDDRMVQDDLKCILRMYIQEPLFCCVKPSFPSDHKPEAFHFLLCLMMVQLHHVFPLAAQGATSYGELAELNIRPC